METNLILAYLGMAFMVAGPGIGSCIGLSICGRTVVGAMKKDPTQFGKYVGLSALPSSQGLYGFVAFYLSQPLVTAQVSSMVAWALLACGIIMASVSFYSAVRQSKVLADGIAATAAGHNVFVSAMVMGVFPELYAILALLATILTINVLS